MTSQDIKSTRVESASSKTLECLCFPNDGMKPVHEGSPKKSVLAGLMLSAVTPFLAPSVSAQSVAGRQDGPSANSTAIVAPTHTYDGVVPLGGRGDISSRLIGLHVDAPRLGDGQANLVRVSHEPLMLPVENKRPLPGQPAVIFSIDYDNAPTGVGQADVEFRFRLGGPELSEILAARLDSYIPSAQGKKAIISSEEVVSAVVECRVKGSGREVLSTGESDSLARCGDQFSVNMPFTPTALTRFTDLYAKNKIQFVIRYSYEANEIAGVSSTVKITSAMVQRALSDIQSKQDDGVPLTQEDVDKFTSKLRDQVIKATVVVGDATFLMDPTITQMATSLFVQGKMGEAEMKRAFENPEQQAALASHMRALVTEYHEGKLQKNGGESQETKEEWKKMIDSITVTRSADGSIGLVVPITPKLFAGASGSLGKEESEQKAKEFGERMIKGLSEYWGISAEASKDYSEYAVSSIRSYKIIDNVATYS